MFGANAGLILDQIFGRDLDQALTRLHLNLDLASQKRKQEHLLAPAIARAKAIDAYPDASALWTFMKQVVKNKLRCRDGAS